MHSTQRSMPGRSFRERQSPEPTHLGPARRSQVQLQELLGHLTLLIEDGLTHGFFEYRIKCEIGSGGRRQVVIHAGKSHKFNIPADEVSS